VAQAPGQVPVQAADYSGTGKQPGVYPEPDRFERNPDRRVVQQIEAFDPVDRFVGRRRRSAARPPNTVRQPTPSVRAIRRAIVATPASPMIMSPASE